MFYLEDEGPNCKPNVGSAYYAFGKAGGTVEQFFSNGNPKSQVEISSELEKGILAKDKILNIGGVLISSESKPTYEYAMGLVAGGHIDILKKFYEHLSGARGLYDNNGLKNADGISVGSSYEVNIKTVFIHALRSAVVNKSVYMFDEIKQIYPFEDVERTVRIMMSKNPNSNVLLRQFDTLMRTKNEPSQEVITLLARLDDQITSCEKESKANPEMERYPQKVAVLTEVKKYLYGESNLDTLRKVVDDNPKYDKGRMIARTVTGKLLDEALTLKGDMLKPAAPRLK